MHILHSSEYPKTTFAVLDSMKCLVADNSLDTIFSHLKSFYTPRKAQKIEAKGFYYELKQYVVKFGSIVTGSTNRGIVVEVRMAVQADLEVNLCRWFSWGVASLPEGKSRGLCLVQLSAKHRLVSATSSPYHYIAPKDKSCFSQGERSAVQLPLDRAFALWK